MNSKRASELTEALDIGNTETFDNLFRSYYAPLCHFAANFLQSDDEAKDIVEDLFLKLWQKQQFFDNAQHAQAYLYRCTRNACLNFLKQGQRSTKRYNVLIADTTDTMEEDCLVAMIRSEVWGEIYRAIEKLPSQCNKVITMSFIDGNSNEEIADALNLSVQTVKNHKVRGLHILRDTLSDNLLLLLILHSFIK